MAETEFLVAGDEGFDESRRVWNAMVDHRPALIARCRETRDVVVAIATARREGLEIGVRCGGHSVVGLAVPEGGLMIDLTPMGAVRVDAERRRAWVQGGALLGALDAATSRMVWPRRPATSRTPGSAGSPWAAAWAGSPVSTACPATT